MINGGNPQPRVSVNLDIANLPPEAPSYILREAAAYGRIVIARAFADYRRNDLADLPVQLFQYGFQLIHCPSWPNGGGRLKSVVDSILAQDLRDQAEDDPSLEVFVLGSGDRDFMAAVHALRRHGRRVIIAAAPDASNRSLLAAADGYIPLSMPDRPERLERAERFERYPASIPRAAAPTLPPVQQTLAVAPPAAVRQPPLHRTSAATIAPPPTIVAQPAAPAPTITPPPAAPMSAAAATPTVEPAPAAVPVPGTQPPAAEPLRPTPQELVPPLPALIDQILTLAGGRPPITPRQVLQMLAPRNEQGSARLRQAVGDAVAMLLQQGKLVRRREMVRGRATEVLAVPTEQQTTEAVSPLPALEEAAPVWSDLESDGDEALLVDVAPRATDGRQRNGAVHVQDQAVATAADVPTGEAVATPSPTEELPAAAEPEPAKPRRRARRRTRTTGAAAEAEPDGEGRSGTVEVDGLL